MYILPEAYSPHRNLPQDLFNILIYIAIRMIIRDKLLQNQNQTGKWYFWFCAAISLKLVEVNEQIVKCFS